MNNTNQNKNSTNASIDSKLLELSDLIVSSNEDFLKYTVIRRNGSIVPFVANKIIIAVTKAYIAIHGINSVASVATRSQIEIITKKVLHDLKASKPLGGAIHIEDIQNQVEIALMRGGEYEVARAYIIYREQRNAGRIAKLHANYTHKHNEYNDCYTKDNLDPLVENNNFGTDTPGNIEQQNKNFIANLNNNHDQVQNRQTDSNQAANKIKRYAKFINYQFDNIESKKIKLDYNLDDIFIFGYKFEVDSYFKQDVSLHDELGHYYVMLDIISLAEIIEHKLLYFLPSFINNNSLDSRNYITQDYLDTIIAKLLHEIWRNIYNNVTLSDLYKIMILSARQMIEIDPIYNYLTTSILLSSIIFEVFGFDFSHQQLSNHYVAYFKKYITIGIEQKILNPKLAEFDLDLLAKNINCDNDKKFKYLGLQTLYDRYFIHLNGRRIELPQSFFMRVAMGLALNEKPEERNVWAIKFYQVLSNFDFMSSTPTLFNSGTIHSQLSSCYISTVSDDLHGIYDSIKDNALLSKFAGGLGNDWTNIRSMGAKIKGTNGNSQGVIPFLKVVNDTAVAVNQGGKRKGAVCVYLEVWHLDIEEFLELRKNTGDDRRRCHDMNTAVWIPDLFMLRVSRGQNWTLFSPDQVPSLHDLFGDQFQQKYEEYERLAHDENNSIRYKTIPALQLWRKMLSMLFETGHPWITFKDPCNIRSPQQHVGVIHSSNLCTEITLNTNSEEIAVCNLGSVNLVNHLKLTTNRINCTDKDDNHDVCKIESLDLEKLKQTIDIAVRMLDNVIDVNFYPVDKARIANMRHRPIGLGIMGFQDCLQYQKLSYASEQAVKFADYCMEVVSYYAIYASSNLAKIRGKYSSYDGSLWDRDILPIDSLKLLAKNRGLIKKNSSTGDAAVTEATNKYEDSVINIANFDYTINSQLDWHELRMHIKQYGMRNSNCLAIAPTATIANIIGVSASIEPNYQNLFVKSNLSGEFTVVNEILVEHLRKLDLWDDVMLADLKYLDGSIQSIDRIPEELKKIYLTAFEVEAKWIVQCGARRQKWIDQSQSLNIYVREPSGKLLDNIYKNAWALGLKTTYYLRALSATAVEKSTAKIGVLNAVVDNSHNSQDGNIAIEANAQFGINNHNSIGNNYNNSIGSNSINNNKMCSIDNPDCESCQ